MLTVVLIRPRRTARIIIVLVEEPPARLRALRDPVRVHIRVDLEARGVALEEVHVLHRPPDDGDGDLGVGEGVVAGWYESQSRS